MVNFWALGRGRRRAPCENMYFLTRISGLGMNRALMTAKKVVGSYESPFRGPKIHQSCLVTYTAELTPEPASQNKRGKSFSARLGCGKAWRGWVEMAPCRREGVRSSVWNGSQQARGKAFPLLPCFYLQSKEGLQNRTRQTSLNGSHFL